MEGTVFDRAAPKPELYATLRDALEALIGDERDAIANLANASALIWQALPAINWAGFYLEKDGQLVLGPFQGKPACIRIAIGKGVCGTAASRRETVLVADVHAFPGHIVCDEASRSEIVVPLVARGKLIGVLDVDAPEVGRFDAEDRAGLEAVGRVLSERLAAAS